jgi:hypothetical protein
MLQFILVTLYSLTVLAMTRSVLVTSVEFSKLLTFSFSLAAILILVKRFRRATIRLPYLSGMGLVLLALILIFRIGAGPIHLLVLGLFLAGLRLLVSEENKREIHLLGWLEQANLIYFIVMLGYRHIPSLYAAIQGYSEFISSSAAKVILNKAVLLGPSASGFWILLHLVILQLIFTIHIKKGIVPAFSGSIGLILIQPLYIALQNSSLTLGWPPEKLIQANLLYWLIGFPIVAVTCLIALNQFTEKGCFSFGKKAIHFKLQVTWLGILAVLFTLSTYRIDSAVVENNRILLLDEGFVDWKLPNFEKFGPYETGLFGALPGYLEANGWKTRIAKPPLDQALLKDIGILVVINPQRLWDENELMAVDAYVRDGGALYVLGDHTDIMGTRKSLNRLIGPYGIGFNFDSGYPVREAFRFCYDFFPHQVTSHVDVWNKIIISVGATLEISKPAYPVIVGKFGFSDLGNMMNAQGAFLGNYAYERGEKFGDIVLAAAACHGKGKVLVFGDTSPLQNGALSYAFDTFVQPTFHWLASHKSFRERNLLKTLSFLVLVFLIAAAIWRVLLDGPFSIALHFIFLAVSFCFFLVNHNASQVMISSKITAKSRAYIDVSHLQTNSLGSLRKEGTGALVINLLRNGYSPYLLRDFSSDVKDQCRLIVSIAPSKPYSSRELKQLRNFIENGGLFLLSTGYEEKAGSVTLLDYFNLDIQNVPLGPVPIIRPPDFSPKAPQFINAWPVTDKDKQATIYGLQRAKMQPSYQTDAAFNGSLSLYTSDHYSIVLFKKIGKGGILVIGDTFFLGEDNLENLKYYKEGNILFLRDIFHEIDEAL